MTLHAPPHPGLSLVARPAVPAPTASPQRRAIEQESPIDIQPEQTVEWSTILRAVRVAIVIVALGLIGATFAALIVLGKSLLALGAAVAFTMILFIGMPLMLAAIEDAIESDH